MGRSKTLGSCVELTRKNGTLMDWLEDCLSISEHQEEIQRWIETNEHVVLVYYPDKSRLEAYSSKWSLVEEELKNRGMTTVCAPMWNVTMDRIETLQRDARGERPEGRPLSIERQFARKLISRDVDYESCLFMIKTVIGNPKSYEASADYSFGRREEPTLTRNQATKIRNAVDREWQLQKGIQAPAPPRLWWKIRWTPRPPNDSRIDSI